MEGIRLSSTIDELTDLGVKYFTRPEVGSRLNLKLLELYCLYQITATLSDKMDLEATTKVAKRIFQTTFPIDHYSLFLIDEHGQELVAKNWFGFRRQSQPKTQYTLDEDIFGAALQNGNPIYIENIRQSEKNFSYYPELSGRKGSFLCLPLLSDTTNEPLGTINLYRKEINGFTSQERRLFEKLSQQVARVLDKVLIYHQTRELSVTDDLTKIANRRYFNRRFEREMQRSQRYNRALSVIMIDIDHFKNFNDAHGHLKGDDVLRSVAQILERNLRKADLIARFGGEEFIVLLPEIDKAHAQKVTEKLRTAVESYHFKNGDTQPLGKITISLGLASYPEDALQAEALLEAADRMLYLAKSLGRNQAAYISDRDRKVASEINYDYNLATAG
ncbi:MAG: sensor domain-containing diguanylate cyclase [bacterium]